MYPLERFCCICGQAETPDNPLSVRGKHGNCATAVVALNIAQIRAKDGPFYFHWVKRLAAGALGQPLDDAHDAS